MPAIALDQLTQAEAQLVAQETELSSQLAELREKIQGLQTVIAMFDGDEDGLSVASEPESEVEADADIEADVEPESNPEPVVKAAPVKRRGRPKKAAAAKPAKKTTRASKTTASVKSTKKKRGPGRSAKWQTYIRDEYSSTPLPDVVANVVKSKPKQVFKIAGVMEELFPTDDMPKADFLKARNRVSNILSAGARSGDWHRGRGGTYSCTKKAVA